MSEKEAWEALFIRSSIQLLFQGAEIFKQRKKDDISKFLTPEYLDKLGKVITQLIFFLIKNCEEGENPLTVEGQTSKKRQAKIRQFRIIELLTDILYYPFQT